MAPTPRNDENTLIRFSLSFRIFERLSRIVWRDVSESAAFARVEVGVEMLYGAFVLLNMAAMSLLDMLIPSLYIKKVNAHTGSIYGADWID